MTPDEAALLIRGLVCGLPGERARRRQLVMLKAYKGFVDASNKGDPDFLVLAGYVAPTVIWEAFSKEWQVRLDQAGLKYFKMNELASQPEIAAYFYRVIEECEVPIGISCVIHTKELVKAVREFPFPADFQGGMEQSENPYFFGFKAIIQSFIKHQVHLGITEPVDFIFDEESEQRRTLGAWDWFKVGAPPELRGLMGAAPIFLDDKIYKPLQAADLLAWWIRKWEYEGGLSIPKLPFPWGESKIDHFHIVFRERHFWEELTKLYKPRMFSPKIDPRIALQIKENRENGVTMTLPDPSSPLNRF